MLNTPTLEDLIACTAEEPDQTEGETDQTAGTDTSTETDADIPFDNSDGRRPLMTRAECAIAGGSLVDNSDEIDEGAIHRPEYRCESGEPPVARITYLEGESKTAGGEVCCL